MKIKRTIPITGIFLVLLASAHSQQLKTAIGMKEKEVRSVLRTNIPLSANELSLNLDTVSGVKGQWTYRFNTHKELDWIHFDKYYDGIFIKSNFDSSLSATNKLINAYTKIFGKPDLMVVSDTSFTKNGKAKLYEIKKAKWVSVNGMKIIIRFISNNGIDPHGKNFYYYLIEVNQFAKNYPDDF